MKRIHVPMNQYMPVGFGECSLYCGHERIFTLPNQAEGDFYLKDLQEIALKFKTDAKWFAFRFTALSTQISVMQKPNDWTLEYEGMGFADDENAAKDLAVLEQVKQECLSLSLKELKKIPHENLKHVEISKGDANKNKPEPT